jgi:hypothetical protein
MKRRRLTRPLACTVVVARNVAYRRSSDLRSTELSTRLVSVVRNKVT